MLTQELPFEVEAAPEPEPAEEEPVVEPEKVPTVIKKLRTWLDNLMKDVTE